MPRDISTPKDEDGTDDELDMFDEVLNLEERFYNEGLSAGRNAGAMQGHAEGYNFGVAKGRQIGEEIGHMKGFVLTLQHLHDTQQYIFSDRLVKSFHTILEAIEALPLDKIQSEHESGDDDLYEEDENAASGSELMTSLEQLKSKFKVLEIRVDMLLKKSGSSTSATKVKDSLMF